MTKVLRRAARTLPLVLARVFGAGVTGGLAVYVARTQGAEASGKFFYFVSTLTILSVLTRLGAEPFLTARIAPQASEGTIVTSRVLIATSAAVSLMVAVATGLVGLGSVVSSSLTDRMLADVSLAELGLAVLGLNAVWIAGGYCRAIGRASLSIFIETGLFSLWLLGLLEISRVGSFETTPRVVALAVAVLLPAITLVFVAVFAHRGWARARTSEVREALRGIISFGAVTITNGIVILIPLQVLGWNGLDHDAGVYNAALRVSMFVGAFGVVIKSVIVRNTVVGSGGQTTRAQDVRQSALIAVPWILVSVVVASQGRHLARIFGSDFDELRSIVLIMLVAQCLYVAGNLIETRAVLAGERAMLNLTSLATLLTAITVTPPLVDAYELHGAVWGFAITITVSRTLLALAYLRGGRSETLGASASSDRR